ncbi:MAG TPA: 3-oxoacyl-ACP reductase family protein [Candidatus Sulfopaludibacter sp.]|jgi:3-oxoacyl-[acyl-carrier protein] reductase|nr:3-oxoacyl-ACP reductase family protein [Candidatus Sulfopaludibacter sp.]
MDELSGKTALVTGSSRGIGRAIALGLAGAGCDIVVNYQHRSGEAEETAARIRHLGRRCAVIQADVSVASEVTRLVGEAEQQLGPAAILVNNAGIARVQRIEEIAESDWDELIDVNLKSCFLCTQAVVAGMRSRKWGRIINLSSVAAQIGGVVGPHYAASKAGMLGLTYYYASHLAREGVTVNAIAPALVETEMVTANLNAKPERIPVGRFGDVEEVADVAVMLARNAYITGQTINVNGGWYIG